MLHADNSEFTGIKGKETGITYEEHEVTWTSSIYSF